MKKSFSIILTVSVFAFSTSLLAESITMNITAEHGSGAPAGEVQITKTKYGLLLTPNLKGLTPGIHGFHVHEKASCDDNGMAAGGHFDPKRTNKHLGPYNDNGHLGDLPVIYVEANGSAITPVMAPRLTSLDSIKNHALMVHHDGDNYSDTPQKLGGGGTRMACGIIS